MSYFAEPNFIIYDEWFDDDFEKTKTYDQTINTKAISNIHEFFYNQSNYKIGASENKIQLFIKANEKELITNNYLAIPSAEKSSISNRKFRMFKKSAKSKLKFNITKKIIYSLSIFSFIFVFGLLILFISQSKKNESNISEKTFNIKKEFLIV